MQEALILNNTYDNSSYKNLKEKIKTIEWNVSKFRKAVLIIICQLQPYYKCILSMDGMEVFDKLNYFYEYAEKNINNFNNNELNEYITLCNEVGQVIDQIYEPQLFSEEEIMVMSDRYWSGIELLSEKDKIINRYNYNIFSALYYLMGFLYYDRTEKDVIEQYMIEIINYIFEYELLNFNEDLYDLTGDSFVDSCVIRLMDLFGMEEYAKEN